MVITKTLEPAIDVHGHYGLYCKDNPFPNEWLSASAEEVVERAREVAVEFTVVSPLEGLMPYDAFDVHAANEDAARLAIELDGLLQWVILNPLEPQSYEQAAEMLQSDRCMGIKIHPEEHAYEITAHGEAIFSFAAEHGAVVLAHSGDPRSLPNDFLSWANAFPEMQLILAHLGNGGAAVGDPNLQVNAIAASKHNNVYTDTSGMRSFVSGLLEWAVAEIGVDRILFGTDTPLYSTAAQRARIDQASLSDVQKRAILYDNAAALLPLPATQKTRL